jgi:hypothetical protein
VGCGELLVHGGSQVNLSVIVFWARDSYIVPPA